MKERARQNAEAQDALPGPVRGGPFHPLRRAKRRLEGGGPLTAIPAVVEIRDRAGAEHMDKETGPATQSPSVIADLLLGEEPPDKYFVDGRLIRTFRLPVGGLGCSRSGSASRTGPRRSGPAASTGSSTANLPPSGRPPGPSARRSGASAPRNPRLVVSSISSGQNIVQHDTPASILASALAGSRGWEWLRHHVTRDRHPRITGLPSAAERDATVDGVYLAAPFGGEPGLVIVVDDFSTRGATFADIARAIRESNPE